MIDRINIMPEELLAKKAKRKFPLKYFIVSMLGIIYIVTFNSGITFRTKEIDKKIEELRAKNLQLEFENMRFTKLLEETEAIMERINLIKSTSKKLRSIVKKRVYWSDILKEMSYIVPVDLWIANITSRDVTVDVPADHPKETVEKTYKEVTIKGSAYKNKTIKTFVENLERSYFLTGIKLLYIKKRIVNKVFTVYEFEIVSTVKEKA